MNYLPYLFLLFVFNYGITQSKPVVTKADYERAAFFQKKMQDKVYQLRVRPNWLPDSTGFWYLSKTRIGKTFLKVDFNTRSQYPVFDHEKLAKTLKDSLQIEAIKEDLPFDQIKFIDQNTIEIVLPNQTYILNLKTQLLEVKTEQTKETMTQATPYETPSPDGKWVAYAQDYNLFVKSTVTGEVIQLSTKGEKNYEYASYYGWFDKMEGEGGDRPQRFYVSWSPDSKRILTSICDLREAEKMYLLDWSIDTLYKPKMLSYYRGSPGDTTIVKLSPVIFDVEQRKEIKPDLPPTPHFNSISLDWINNGALLQGTYHARGFQKLYGITVDPVNGKAKTIYTDISDTNIDFTYFNWEYSEKTQQFFLTSERSGWNQIYVVELEGGAPKRITQGDYVVKNIFSLDEEKQCLYFSASGKESNHNPYYNYLYRVNFDGSDLRLLTPENANHDIFMAPRGDFFIDNYSTTNQPTNSVLRTVEDGTIVTHLGKGDVKELLEMGWSFPEVFKTKARDGKTDIYTAIWKPTNFDPNKKYPVIDNSYTGPHTQVFPNRFNRALSNSSQALAELGFIVVRIDGLGSIGRSKAFQDWSYKRLGFGLTDHVIAIRELGKRYAWVDITRVGIFGHSAGGYDAAHALLQFPDFYKVAVSSSADHDHRMEKAWWPEMYMGWPVDSAYHLQSNITMAPNLKGKLLITHGALDDNVNPSATFKLAEALIQADKEFDLIIFPSQRHGYRGQSSDYFIKKRWNYFVEHLLGAEPLWPIAFPD